MFCVRKFMIIFFFFMYTCTRRAAVNSLDELCSRATLSHGPASRRRAALPRQLQKIVPQRWHLRGRCATPCVSNKYGATKGPPGSPSVMRPAPSAAKRSRCSAAAELKGPPGTQSATVSPTPSLVSSASMSRPGVRTWPAKGAALQQRVCKGERTAPQQVPACGGAGQAHKCAAWLFVSSAARGAGAARAHISGGVRDSVL